MADYSAFTLGFLALAGFIGSFVDSVVGGGGLITAPALMATGIPIPYVLGTGKVNVIGTLMSFFTFYRSGKIDKKALRAMPLSFLGGAVGAMTVNALPEYVMRYIVVTCLVVVAFYTFFRKDWGEVELYRFSAKRTSIAIALLALALGYYDGFFGPGAGTFLLCGFLAVGFDFVKAAGNAKACNVGSNLGALCVFISAGKVIIPYAIVMGIVQLLGARVGAKMAISKGAKFVRPLFLVITTLLIGKQVYELFLK